MGYLTEFRMAHAQKWVKVNAPVDAALEELVRSLSAFPRLQTIESCQGSRTRPAWVCFSYGNSWEHPWRELASFVLGYLGPGLKSRVGDRADLLLRVATSGRVQAELAVRPGAMRQTVTALRDLARRQPRP